MQATKDVTLTGNVVLVSSDGLRLETERLRWDADAQRAWTDEPVTIYDRAPSCAAPASSRAWPRKHPASRAASGPRSSAAAPEVEGRRAGRRPGVHESEALTLGAG